MGVNVLPDHAQSKIKEILDGLDLNCYIDDCGIFSNTTFEEHLDQVQAVLQHLNDNGMKVNPLKCNWAVQETDFLGYWMTPTAVKQ